MYIDPNLRLPMPHQSQGQQQQSMAALSTPQQQQQNIPPLSQMQQHHSTQQQHQQGRQSTDGLGLLLEAFDTHQTAASAVPHQVPSAHHPPVPPPPQPQAAGPGGSGSGQSAPYDPHSAAAVAAAAAAAAAASQEYYHHPHHQQSNGMSLNDGYENELGFYMSDGIPPAVQSWDSGGNMGYYSV